MKIAYFDCLSGISGDMVLGALVDAGLDPDLLRAEIKKLGLPVLDMGFAPVTKQHIAATKARVRVSGKVPRQNQEHHLDLGAKNHAHHKVEDLVGRIEASKLDPAVRSDAIRIYRRLAAAEAQVHGSSADAVHLHEVGALDALVDIVGAVAGLRLLGVEAVYASPLHCGTGYVKCAHGRYPVPVPGVVALCRGVPLRQTDIAAELITPTGAAILTTLAQGYGSAAPPFTLEAVGYGAGGRDLEAIPNVLRLRLGHTAKSLEGDRAVLIEANIDDMNPEVYGFVLERLFEEGAKEVYTTPVLMKKGRPGTVLSVLVDEDQSEAMAQFVLAETTTIGVRLHPVDRRKLPRRIETIHTPYGEIRVKVSQIGERQRRAPEYEDCARLARQRRVPILEVYTAALRAAEE